MVSNTRCLSVCDITPGTQRVKAKGRLPQVPSLLLREAPFSAGCAAGKLGGLTGEAKGKTMRM
ncbi:hypothetical protein E2C01_100892 [Portunus trituberculatus]|uniref:Uncharacterized protein n=1 Tax=Portunus trituberculatus TaxID=210409 RepID=A0A5B7K837_PORTR|nr:hypothetical protein [Portunus trituberculatus]